MTTNELTAPPEDSGLDSVENRQRSASHSSLHSAYRSHGRPNAYTQPRPGRRTPLRSVNENTALLRSPGPLESMLKTTTETGDIGLFSITAVPPSARPPPPPARPPPPPAGSPTPFKDATLLSPGRATATCNNRLQDDRRRLPSYRDTTSEIISLYGSDTQPSFPRSFSPSLDGGQRSFSLTTCSTRRIPSIKSTGTWKSYAGEPGLQRPRSPWLYPTRLRRPNVRPSSPALTDSGAVDYSRMVGLEQFSQRTIHGLYKPSYRTSPRRPPPLAVYNQKNLSTHSLPFRAVDRHICRKSGNLSRGTSLEQALRTRSPKDMSLTRFDIPSTSPLQDASKHYGQKDHSICRDMPQRSTSPLYYDYSEAFEAPSRPQQKFGEYQSHEAPLCPVPQRAASLRQPKILMNEAEELLDFGSNLESAETGDADTEKALVFVNAEEVANALEDESTGLHHAASIDTILAAYMRSDKKENDFELQTIAAISPRSGQKGQKLSESKRQEDIELETGEIPATVAQMRDVHARDSFTISDSLIRPHLSSPAHFVEDPKGAATNVAILGKEPEIHHCSIRAREVKTNSTEQTPKTEETPALATGAAESHGRKRLDNSQERQGTLSDCAMPRNTNAQFKKGHGRRVAASHIAVAQVPDPTDELSKEGYISGNDQSPCKNPHSTLQDEPLYPLLQPQKSAPRLMKDLPPIPMEAERPVCDHYGDIDEGEGTQRRHAINGVIQPHILSCNDVRCSTDESTEPVPRSINVSAKRVMRKFQIRMKTSTAPSTKREARHAARHYISGGKGSRIMREGTHARPRLKLKMSDKKRRSTRPSARMRRGDLKQYIAMRDWEVSGHVQNLKGLERSPTHVTKSTNRDLAMVISGNESEPASTQLSDQFNIPYPPSLHSTFNQGSFSSQCRELPQQTHSLGEDTRQETQGRLRQKLSIWRLKRRSPKSSSSETNSDNLHGERFGILLRPPEVTLHTRGNRSSHKFAKSRSVTPGLVKRRSRMRRWAEEAKRAVRACVKRRLEGSSSTTGE